MKGRSTRPGRPAQLPPGCARSSTNVNVEPIPGSLSTVSSPPMHESEQIVREVLEVGARGFLLKSDAARDLIAAVEALQRRTTFFTSSVAEIVLDGYLHRGPELERPLKDRLTPREREVVQLLAEGKTSKEVASVLNLSVKTAETHRTNVMTPARGGLECRHNAGARRFSGDPSV